MKKLVFAICLVIYANLTYHKQTDEELINAGSVITSVTDTLETDSLNPGINNCIMYDSFR
jgi:hypothetical protein